MLKFNKMIDDNLLNKLFLLFTVIIVIFAIIGGVNNYSPVPYWDMWDGYLNFYANSDLDSIYTWWSQHNEHRIFLSRILFWIDLSFFSGSVWFLIIFNYFILILIILMLWICLSDINISYKRKEPWLSYFLLGWLFYWSQSENLTWGFQSQFFLAQLIPLSAFYSLYKSNCKESIVSFFVSIFLGVISSGTMANGIFTLPLLLFLSFLLRCKVWQKSVIFLSSLITISLYFYNYKLNHSNGSIYQSLLNHPYDIIEYFFVYLGSPFYYITGKGDFGRYIALFLGIISSVLFLCHFYNLKHKSKNTDINKTLIIFMLYIGVTAFSIAIGRANFGVGQALSSRYTTPAIIGWATLFILSVPYLYKFQDYNQRKVKIFFLFILVLLIPYQSRALKYDEDRLFNRKLAALELELNIRDEHQIKYIFPSSEWALNIVKNKSSRMVSIFSQYPYFNLRERLGESVKIDKQHQVCLGSIKLIKKNNIYVVTGWISDHHVHGAYVLDGDNKIVGAVITRDKRKYYFDDSDNLEFTGYIINSVHKPSNMKIYDLESGCYIASSFSTATDSDRKLTE